MASPKIEELRNITDFAPLYRWQLIFSQNSLIFSGISPQDLDLRCESTDIPKATASPVEVNIRGHKLKQPGITNYTGTLALTFVETVDNKISQFIKNWRDACWEPNTGKSKPKKELETEVTLQRLDNENNAIWEYKLIGCFLEDYEPGGTMDGVSSEVLKPSITLSYDYFTDSEA